MFELSLIINLVLFWKGTTLFHFKKILGLNWIKISNIWTKL